ncbi:MAG: transglycosylase domain-containing protein [Akkermansiaceae bacterium]|nr:transglycosylase domain-containing protein [Akkermansiaceae bacterium]
MSWKPAAEPRRLDRWLPDWVPGWLRGLIRWCIKWSLVGAILALAVCLFYFYLSWQYDMRAVAKMPEHSVIIDRHGMEFATIHGQKRRQITRSEIPDVMVDALLAREDARFFEHSGVDSKGLVRATLRNIKDRSFTQGASTLTMQLTRNSYDLKAKSLHRKLLEIAVTLRIERHYTKDEILTHYLNRIYFGAGCHGVEEAAQTYFGRAAKELNIGECALLVGIIRGPHLFSPFRNLKGALVQRDEVLERMVQCDYLSPGQVGAARSAPIRLVPEQDRQQGSSYLRESIRKQLNIILDQHDIRHGGLRIHTTLDVVLQSQCEKLLMANIPGLEKGAPGASRDGTDADALQAAVVRMNPKTGGVLALCGGRDFKQSQFNRATHGKRDLGAAFSPFLYAMAMERGKVALAGRPLQTGRQLGVDETIRLGKRFGFSGPFLKSEDLYRGSLSASPMELAVAASALSNSGVRPDPFFILKITDAKGRVMYEYHPGSTPVVGKDVASETVAAHASLRAREGRVSASSACRDVWATRIGSADVTVLWLGYDQPRKVGPSDQVKRTTGALMRSLKDAP